MVLKHLIIEYYGKMNVSQYEVNIKLNEENVLDMPETNTCILQSC